MANVSHQESKASVFACSMPNSLLWLWEQPRAAYCTVGQHPDARQEGFCMGKTAWGESPSLMDCTSWIWASYFISLDPASSYVHVRGINTCLSTESHWKEGYERILVLTSRMWRGPGVEERVESCRGGRAWHCRHVRSVSTKWAAQAIPLLCHFLWQLIVTSEGFKSYINVSGKPIHGVFHYNCWLSEFSLMYYVESFCKRPDHMAHSTHVSCMHIWLL